MVSPVIWSTRPLSPIHSGLFHLVSPALSWYNLVSAYHNILRNVILDNNRYDQHIHSSFSTDSDPKNTISNIIETAIILELAGIAVVDHLDPLWPSSDETLNFIDIDAYKTALTEAENTYGNRISFAKGIELGFMPGEALSICRETVDSYAFDFVIGSVHCSPKMALHLPAFTAGRPLADIVEEYYALLYHSIRDYKNYDVLGHINAVDRYTSELAPEGMYMPYVDEVLKVAVSDGKGIEINTSAFRYGLGGTGTPTIPIIKRFKELGGEIATIGSDAHRASDIGSFIKEGEEMLLACGFKYFAVYKNRTPEFVKL